jgi:pimeloyl-ACP methyl ester carboxylesterase
VGNYASLHVVLAAVPFVLLLAAACGSSTASAPGGTDEGVARNGDVELRWFLDFPEGDGPFPAIVFGPGSGSISASHKSHVEFARGLNELGFAVMRYDKRGTGGSDGEVVAVSTANSSDTIPLLASDMQSVLDELLLDGRIDRDRVGLFGASQAGWYMPLVAQATQEVDFMIVVTGAVAPVGFQNRYEELTRIDGLSQEEAEAQLGLLGDFDGELGFDALPIVEVLDIPMLYLLGADDPAGPREANLAAVTELAGRGADVQVTVYDRGRHSLPGIDIWPDVERWLESIQ